MNAPEFPQIPQGRSDFRSSRCDLFRQPTTSCIQAPEVLETIDHPGLSNTRGEGRNRPSELVMQQRLNFDKLSNSIRLLFLRNALAEGLELLPAW